MDGTLYTYLNPENFRAYKVLVSAQYSGADVKVVSEPPEFTLGVTNRSEEFLELFPLGKVPAFKTAEGAPIFESNAIAHYVANATLRGVSPLDQALVIQFINFADTEILPAACSWVFPTLGIMPQDQKVVKAAQEDIKRALEILNSHLATRTFLVGERVTLADITVACNLLLLYKQVLEPKLRDPYGNVTRWFVTCVNQPQFKTVVGEVPLCEKMATFDAKRYNELHPKKDTKKDKKEKKPEQPAKEAAQKEAAKDDDDDDDDGVPRQPAFKDPYASLPKSSFVMDQFKRVYSNEDKATKALPFLWENFDKEGYSIWRCDYKYNDELKMTFMSANLIGGMFQRIERLRKTAFASMLVVGEDYKSEITGVWIMRGQQLAFDLVEDWNIDAPQFAFVKLDPDSEVDRQLVNKYFLMEGFDQEIAEGKIFK